MSRPVAAQWQRRLPSPRRWAAALIRQFSSRPLLVISAVNALVFPLAILTSIVLARLLPKGEYGQLVYFYAGAGLLRLLMNLGLGTLLSRDVAAAAEEAGRRNVIICSMTVVRLASILAALPLVLGVAAIAPIDLLGPMALAAVCASLADFVFAIVAGLRRTLHIGWMSAFQPLAYLLLAGGAVALHQASAALLMQLYALSFLGMAGLGALLSASGGLLTRPGWRDIQPGYIKGAVAYVAPSYIASLTTQVWSTLVVGAFGLTGQFERSAEFGIAFSMVTLAVAITGPTVLTVFFPQASYLFGTNRHAELHRQIRQTFLLFLRGLVAIALLIAAGAPLLVGVFGRQYASAAPLIIALAPLAPLAGLLPVATLSLFAINRPWPALIGPGVQVAVVAALVALVRPISATTLTLAALASTGLALAVQFGVLARTLRVTLLDPGMVRAIGVAGGALLLLALPVALDLALAWRSGAAGCLLALYGLVEVKPRRFLASIRPTVEVTHDTLP